jgi:mono/diheme cytochrome c family protein
MPTAWRIAVFLVVTAAAVVTYAHEGHAPGPSPQPTPEERAAFETAKPAFERNCFRCHTSAGKKSKRKAMQHLAMDGYPFTGHHANEVGKVVRKALGVGGRGKATMPSDDPGSVTGADLRLIVAWADAFDRAHPSPAPVSTEKGPARAH